MFEKKRSFKLVWELLTVTLGVFLALLVNNISEQRKQEVLVKRVVAGIIQEVEQNKQVVVRSRDYHADFLTKLNEKQKGLTLQLNMAPIISSAWDVAKRSEVLHLLDYDMSLAFSEIYSWHEEYNKLRFLSDQALYQIRFSNFDYGTSYLTRWHSAFQDFLYTEEKLLDRYEKALEIANSIN